MSYIQLYPNNFEIKPRNRYNRHFDDCISDLGNNNPNKNYFNKCTNDTENKLKTKKTIQYTKPSTQEIENIKIKNQFYDRYAKQF